MDLNYLLQRHQVSLMRADAADACEVRNTHVRFAQAYATRIDDLATVSGATAASLARD